MAETLFALDRRNFRDCQQVFRGDRQQEYYRGDFWVEDAPNVDVRSERKAVGAMSIIRQRSASNLFFRRSRRHIREDATDLSILWFVRRGVLAFSNQFGGKVARPGDLMVTRSMSPFLIECRTDGDEVHESLHVTVPTHVLRSHIAQDMDAGLHMTGGRPELGPEFGPELGIAERMLSEVFSDDGRLGDPSARLLVDTAIALVANALRSRDEQRPCRQSIADRRLEEVLRFIEVHLSDPQLSTAMVAKGCGISPRYLSFLLRLRETSFSELVWDQRLEKARDWLGRTDPRDISISEIAYGVGFKSPAHFSRMFKRVFGANPRDYRGDCGAEPAACDGQGAVDEAFVELSRASLLLQ